MAMSTERDFAVQALCAKYLRPCELVSDDTTTSYVFTPPLSAAEQITLNRIIKIANAAVVGITPAEWQALESDIDGLITYQNIASPTLAQTVLAVKAQSRILKAILRS